MKIKLFLFVLIIIFLFGCIGEKNCINEKISPAIQQSKDFEFCIADNQQYLNEVKAIDPTINCTKGSAGRIGCNIEQYLCIGNIEGKDSGQILCGLSKKDYIEKIEPTYWE